MEVFTQSLQRENQQFNEYLNQYYQKQRLIVKQKKQKFSSDETSAQDEIAEKTSKIRDLKKVEAEQATKAAAVIAAVEAVACEVASLEREASTLPAQIKELDLQTKQLSQQVEEQDKEFQEISIKREGQIKQLSHGLQLFSQRLGLEFVDQPPNGIKLSYRYIDPADPERVFSVLVHVEKEDDTYRASECSPPLEELPLLVEQLNDNSQKKDFTWFVLAVRRQFQKALAH